MVAMVVVGVGGGVVVVVELTVVMVVAAVVSAVVSTIYVAAFAFQRSQEKIKKNLLMIRCDFFNEHVNIKKNRL